jgi:hypothetical protein
MNNKQTLETNSSLCMARQLQANDPQGKRPQDRQTLLSRTSNDAWRNSEQRIDQKNEEVRS